MSFVEVASISLTVPNKELKRLLVSRKDHHVSRIAVLSKRLDLFFGLKDKAIEIAEARKNPKPTKKVSWFRRMFSNRGASVDSQYRICYETSYENYGDEKESRQILETMTEAGLRGAENTERVVQHLMSKLSPAALVQAMDNVRELLQAQESAVAWIDFVVKGLPDDGNCTLPSNSKLVMYLTDTTNVNATPWNVFTSRDDHFAVRGVQ